MSNRKMHKIKSNNNNKWKLINEGASGRIELPKAIMNGAGKYSIKIRAIDMSGNVSDAKEFTYYYDGMAPTINSVITIPSEVGKAATPVIAWNIEDNTTIKVQCSVDGSEFMDISDKNVGSYTLKDGLIIKEGAHTIKLRAIDKYGNISDKDIPYTYSAEANNDKNIAIIPSRSDETYVCKEPTIILSNITDKSKVKMSYKLSLNGNVKSITGSDGFKVSYVSKKTENMNDNGVETNTSEYGVGYIDGDTTRICNTTSKEHVNDKVTQTNTLLIDKNTVEYVVNENNKTETKAIKNKNGSNIIYTVNVKMMMEAKS